MFFDSLAHWFEGSKKRVSDEDVKAILRPPCWLQQEWVKKSPFFHHHLEQIEKKKKDSFPFTPPQEFREF